MKSALRLEFGLNLALQSVAKRLNLRLNLAKGTLK